MDILNKVFVNIGHCSKDLGQGGISQGRLEYPYKCNGLLLKTIT